jgi:hypothetical protein
MTDAEIQSCPGYLCRTYPGYYVDPGLFGPK